MNAGPSNLPAGGKNGMWVSVLPNPNAWLRSFPAFLWHFVSERRPLNVLKSTFFASTKNYDPSDLPQFSSKRLPGDATFLVSSKLSIPVVWYFPNQSRRAGTFTEALIGSSSTKSGSRRCRPIPQEIGRLYVTNSQNQQRPQDYESCSTKTLMQSPLYLSDT